jgi:nucleoside-diphosphate-sugar epimerase
MKILLTGATGYIGKRLLSVLIEQGHEVVCCVRDKNRFPTDGVYKNPKVSLIEIDFLKDIQSSGSSVTSSFINDIDALTILFTQQF